MELHNVAEQILAFTMMLFQTELSCYMYSVIIQENGGADLLDYHVVTPPPPIWQPWHGVQFEYHEPGRQHGL